MNKIVRDRYPVDRLPDDLKSVLGSARYVRLTIEDSEGVPPTRESLLALIELARKGPRATDDPVDRIRKLRDQGDD